MLKTVLTVANLVLGVVNYRHAIWIAGLAWSGANLSPYRPKEGQRYLGGLGLAVAMFSWGFLGTLGDGSLLNVFLAVNAVGLATYVFVPIPLLPVFPALFVLPYVLRTHIRAQNPEPAMAKVAQHLYVEDIDVSTAGSEHVAFLRNSGRAIRQTAGDELAQFGRDAIPVLISALPSVPNPDGVAEGLAMLIQSGGGSNTGRRASTSEVIDALVTSTRGALAEGIDAPGLRNHLRAIRGLVWKCVSPEATRHPAPEDSTKALGPRGRERVTNRLGQDVVKVRALLDDVEKNLDNRLDSPPTQTQSALLEIVRMTKGRIDDT